MIAIGDKLGLGLYTPTQAALYARVSTSLLNRWLFGDRQGESVLKAQFKEEPEHLVSFLDFVQILAVREIRQQFRIPLHKIRQAVENAVLRFGREFPFALKHKTFLMSDGQRAGHGEIIIEVEEKLIQASGKNHGNQVFREVVELYLDKLQFNTDGLAARYCAWGSEAHGIIMDPHVLFGEPHLSKSMVSAHTLWEATMVEGGINAAAEAYGVPAEDVRLACEYFDHLQLTAK